jgi:predicted RNase H-like nuclease (RuvC/YqgF family)
MIKRTCKRCGEEFEPITPHRRGHSPRQYCHSDKCERLRQRQAKEQKKNLKEQIEELRMELSERMGEIMMLRQEIKRLKGYECD